MPDYDAVVVGAGPNGLSAAVELARAGWSVLLVEQADTVGGAARSAEVTRPGFVHDLGSAIHPLAAASPFFRTLPLEEYGLSWVQPDLPLAHPLGDGRAAAMHRSLDRTAEHLGPDGAAYKRLLAPLANRWRSLMEEVLQPVVHLPSAPLLLARFGLRALCPTPHLTRSLFRTDGARALFAGSAAHAARPLSAPGVSAFGLLLHAAGHTVGWPFPEGGAGALTHALAAYFQDLGGEIQTNRRVDTLDALPSARAVLLGLTPRQILRVAGSRLAPRYARRLARYRYGAAAFKIDYALSDPIPWAAPACRRAGTVHVGAPSTRLPRRSRRSPTATSPTAPLSWSPSTAASILPAPPTASTPPGPTATSPTGHASTPSPPSSARSNGLRPASETPSWRVTPWARRPSNGGTQT